MSAPSYPRTSRLNAILGEVIAAEIEILTDPRLEWVTITGVDVAPNMRSATVYYSTVDPDHLTEAGHGLTAASGRLQGRIGASIRMKYTPKLSFEPDPAIVDGERIEAVLRQLGSDSAPIRHHQ